MKKSIFLLFLLASIFLAITGNVVLIYGVFALFFILSIKKYLAERKKSYLICAILASIIIPNNYFIYVSLLVGVILTWNGTTGMKCKWYSMLGILYIFMNIVLNIIFGTQKFINLLFSILYYLPIVICEIKVSRWKIDNDEYEIIIDFMKKSIIIEFIAIVTKFVFHFEAVTGLIDFDWVVGTFGEFQGNILLFYSLFCFTIFYTEFIRTKRFLKYAILSGMIAIMTGSIALLIMYFIVFVMYAFWSKRINIKVKLLTTLFAVVMLVFFVLVTPQWIKNYIRSLTSMDVIESHITKIQDYRNAYINIPKEDKKFLLLGDGPGMYSSRAALTCTGAYLPAYNKIFPISMSSHTKKYLYDKILYVYANNLGSMDSPWSSFISVFAELGLFGLIILIIYFFKKIKEGKFTSKIFIMFFCLSCLIENYLEFPRVIPLVFFAGIIIDKVAEKKERIDKYLSN